jgi:ATP-dependent Lon protease
LSAPQIDTELYQLNLKATIDELSETLYPFEELNKLCSTLKKLFSNLIDIAPYLSEEQTNILINIKDPSQISDKAISVINIPTKEKQEILEKLDVKDKIKFTIKIINREIQRLELGDKIQADVQGEISKSQKEYYLREQLRAIKKELGDEDSSLELDELKEKIDYAFIKSCCNFILDQKLTPYLLFHNQ